MILKLKILLILLLCLILNTWAATARQNNCVGFFYAHSYHTIISDTNKKLNGIVPPCKSCNGFCAHVFGLSNGTGDTVFYCLNFKCLIHMKKSEIELVVYDYNGSHISFQPSDGNVMVNATEMAKPFGKLPANFLKTKEIQEYIEVLERYSNSNNEKIVVVKQGGKEQGTWIHELLAVRFAQWLDAKFSVWVDIQIKKLLTQGKGIEFKGYRMAENFPKQVPVKKKTYISGRTVNFEILHYSEGTEIIPSQWLTLNDTSALKNCIDRMYFVLNANTMEV